VASVVWLANDEFLTIHSLSSPLGGSNPDALFHWLRTDKGRTKFEYRKAPNEPCFPVLERNPASYYVSRIRKWSNLEDAVILSSAASGDIGLLANAQKPLTSTMPASDITNSYTLVTLESDARKATLPLSTNGEMDDTFPIGMAIDLSSTDKIWQPIPGDDLISGESPHPLPAVVVLNHEGILCYWWFVNDEALRQNNGAGVPCPGLVAVEGAGGATATPAVPTSTNSGSTLVQPTSSPSLLRTTQPTFGASPFGAPSKPTFGAPSKPAFGAPSQPSFGSPSALAFGAPSQPVLGPSFPKPAQPAFGASAFAKPALPNPFGGPSSLGTSSPWSAIPTKPAATAFGQPSAFGSPSHAAGTGFGATAALGQKSSPWGTSPAIGSTENKPFGSSNAAQSGFAKLASTSTSSPFGSTSGKIASPFGSSSNVSTSVFASGKPVTPGFGTTPVTPSFGTTQQQSFGSTVTIDSVTGGSTVGTKSIFGNSSFGAPYEPP
jgi:nucleoporin NUP159